MQFLSSGFVVMLFHYDGIVDEWKQFQWSDLVIHVSADDQTKWYKDLSFHACHASFHLYWKSHYLDAFSE